MTFLKPLKSMVESKVESLCFEWATIVGKSLCSTRQAPSSCSITLNFMIAES